MAHARRIVRGMFLGDAWEAVGGIGSVVAALAALVTVFYARKTVRESVSARRENHEAHSEDMREQRQATEASTAAHREEMMERRRALDADVTLQRIVHLERMAETLVDLIRVARAEELEPPPQVEGVVLPRGMTLIPSVLTRLHANVVLLGLLGPGEVPKAATDLAHRGAGMKPLEVVGAARAALDEIVELGRYDRNLLLDDSA